MTFYRYVDLNNVLYTRKPFDAGTIFKILEFEVNLWWYLFSLSPLVEAKINYLV